MTQPPSPLLPLRQLATTWLNDANEFEEQCERHPSVADAADAARIRVARECAKELQKTIKAVARKLPKAPKPPTMPLFINTDRDEVADQVVNECKRGRCCGHYLSPGTDVCCWCATSLFQDSSIDHGPFHPDAVPCRVVKP